jgi:outer membrane protein assembly factor BamB
VGVLALDAKTGKRHWSFTPASSGITALSLHPKFSALFAGDREGNVYRLDPATGTTQWQRRVFGGVTAFAREIPGLLVATTGGEVYALDAADGSGYWRRKFPGHISALTAMNGSYRGAGAFVSVFGGPTMAINPAETGTTTWTSDVWSGNSFVLSGQTLFAADTTLVALAVGTGKRRWTGGQTAQCGPAAAGDTVYAASTDQVTAYKFGGGTGIGSVQIGAKRWSHAVEGSPEQGLAVADGAVFVLTEGHKNTPSRAYALEEA